MFVESWPHPHHPCTSDEDGGLAVDTSTTVDVYQLRPDDVTGFVAWSGGTELLINGGPAVLLPGNRPVVERLVGLGDYAVRDGDRVFAVSADGFGSRFQPAADDNSE